MTIQDAWKRILEIRGERVDTKFAIEFWHYSHAPGDSAVRLSVWDGNQHHYAKNLEDLIKLVEVSVGKPGMIDGELPETPEKAKEGQADG